MNIGEKIRLLRKRKAISPEKLGMLCDLSGQYIRKLESGARQSITLATAEKLANGLGVPVSALVDSDKATHNSIWQSPVSALADLETYISPYIPVYAEVSAGPGIEPVDYIVCSRFQPKPETIRGYRAKGLCLEPDIHEGDTIIVDTSLAPQNNDLVVVIIEGQASLKRYRETENDKWLENNYGKIQPEDVYLHGVVVESVHKWR